MTVAALPSSIDYLEDGVTLAFAVPYRFVPNSIEVSRVLASGAVIVLTPGSGYSVSGGTTDAGGTVTLSSTVAGSRLRISRNTPRSQGLDYATGDTFPAESHESALDRAMLIDQEQDARIASVTSRAILVPDGEIGSTLVAASLRTGGNKILAPNAATGAIEIASASAFKGDPGGNTMAIGLFSAAGGQIIATGTDMVTTTGHSVVGYGSADYAYDAAVNGAYVAANPYTSFVSANGRGFRLVAAANDVRQFGAVGNDAVRDTAAFKAMFARGGLLTAGKGPNGDYLINDTVPIGSRTHLSAAPGARIKQASGINKNVLCNAAYLASWTTVSVGPNSIDWTSLSWELSLTWYGHGLVAGDYVWLTGADQGAYRGIFPVISIVSANQIIVKLNQRPVANPTFVTDGAIRVKKADVDITIEGGIFDYNFAQNTDSAQGPQTHCVALVGIHNLTLRDVTAAGTKKFGFVICAVDGLTVDGIEGFGLNSDLLKLYGPAWNGRVRRITGNPGDDLMSIQCREPATFIAYRVDWGNVRDIEIEASIARGLVGVSPMCSVYPTGADATIDNITFMNFIGHCEDNAVSMIDYEGGGKIGTLRFRNFNPRAKRMARFYAAAGTCTIKCIDMQLGPNAQPIVNDSMVTIDQGVSVERFILRDTHITSTEIGAGSAALELQSSGQVKDVRIDNVHWDVPSGYFLYFAGTDKTLRSLNFVNSDIAVTDRILPGDIVNFTANPAISAMGGTLSAPNLFELHSNFSLAIGGGCIPLASINIVKATGTSAQVVSISYQGRPLSTGNWVNAGSTASVNPRGFDIEGNVNDAWWKRGAGNRMRTTIAAGTIPAGAPIICDETTVANSWHSIKNPTVEKY